jgi:hypothetical protein
MTGTYAWIVDSTLTSDERDDTKLVEEADPELSRNGWTGPHDAPAELTDRLKRGEGRVWRTLYDVDYTGHPADERVCHVGRYLDFYDIGDPRGESVDADAEFGPLDDLSRHDCGATDVQYRQEDGTWKSL